MKNEQTWRERLRKEFPRLLISINKSPWDRTERVGANGVLMEQFIASELTSLGQAMMEKIIKEKAIHEQLAKEWTGISITDLTKQRINPHTEKVEVLGVIEDFLTAELSKRGIGLSK